MQQPNENTQNLGDDFEDDGEEILFFHDYLYLYLAPHIKQFLLNYFGDALTNAEAETFRNIEEVIKDGITSNGDMIAHYFYIHRPIKDIDKWDDAVDAYVHDPAIPFNWPVPEEKWYNRYAKEEEEEEEEEEVELPEEAQKIVDLVDDMQSNTKKMATFIDACCEVIVTKTKVYLETGSAYNLVHLSEEGYQQVFGSMRFMAEITAEGLYDVVAEL